ncbi:hypothetical protein ACQ4WP_27880 [Janthinobacterium sp. GB4P2]|uniref:hypothetical protein n=1 Tax=Janthinobacterium sp. GB4P2 TaxID=3424189 RepID=UPI003F200319
MLTLEEVTKKTAEILKLGNDQLGYITQDLVDADNIRDIGDADGSAGNFDKTVKLVLYGHNTRYGAVVINGVTYQCYWFEYGGAAPTKDPGLACGNFKTYYLRMDQFDHNYLDKCSDKTERWSFTSK